MSYNYNSYAVKDGKVFNARGRLYNFDKKFKNVLQDCERPNSISDLSSLIKCDQVWDTMNEMLAVLFSVHLTTFANMSTADGDKVIETSYTYDASGDSPDTIRKRYYYDERQFFYNSRGKNWKEFGTEVITNYTEYKRDNKYVYIKSHDPKFKMPLEGGLFFSWNNYKQKWEASGQVTKR